MKKITLLFTILSFAGFAQQKTTGVVNLLSNTSATLLLNNTNSTATLTLSGPNDRWFALQFGSFADGDGMSPGQDIVYWNNATLVDAFHNGIGSTPTNDTTNNWTLVSSVDNSPSAGLRTIVYTRPLNTGDANDYQFNFADTTIDFAFARRSTAGFTLNNHGGSNRGYAIDRPLTTLGVEDFSLNASQVYPNPSNGNFTVKTKTYLEKINIYSQTGAFIKTIKVDLGSDTAEVDITNLQTGVYLIELVNATEKSWKKVIVE
jgi:hypothetical protein